ncbi:Bgt-2013 [Blumeria graminis f. sp. tritici]|uniref:Serine carboxypeptidase S28 n=3 Tax=Blumeria graminis f. sp. tritici TaxID=62690 RepID=A0A656KIQ7_BLUGR|nr:Serine carboxypeptidase S28 [Blumeria graminis f. sp. tritici 96224]VDB94526.1 Bgt-2013 [Blumeria graminis f. sp. tritici]
MKIFTGSLALAVYLQFCCAIEFRRLGQLIPPKLSIEELSPHVGISALTKTSKVGTAVFSQWLDHNDPGKGMFDMQYWWNAESWAGPGSPVVLFTPGETAATAYTGFLTNHTITGRLAQEIAGAVVIVEHRYWGNSSPYEDLTTKNLQYLTLNQSIMDFIHFAKTVQLPFDTDGSSNADKAPWIFSGGSYAGALAAWTSILEPDTFWAYHASSAPVEVIEDYWEYFTPVQEGMQKNCSSDISRVVDYLDDLLVHGNASEKYAIKQKFGMESLQHDDDFMSMLENGPWLWQSNTFTSGYSGFFKFCDAIENVEPGALETPDENGVGLEKALSGYASWSREILIPGYCQNFGYSDPLETACMDSYDPFNLIFTDYTVNNTGGRQWNWMLCNEPLFYWQDGSPKSQPSLVSRLINPQYWERQCSLFFPPEENYSYGSHYDLNQYTKGWDLTNTQRLIWTSGEFDPWKTSGMSSEFRPNGPFPGTKEQPLNVIPGGFHCSDLRGSDAENNEGVQAVVESILAQVKEWVAEYYTRQSLC